jgi:putative membrane protein
MPFLRSWTWEPAVALGVIVAAIWYAAGLWRLWQRSGTGRSVSWGHAGLFAAGLLMVVVALMSPLDALADTLFAAHMTQHLILITVAAPLLVLGRPLLPMLWALPAPRRRRIGRWWAGRPAARLALAAVTAPSVVWIAHAAVLGFWHVPATYEWAVRHEPVHAVEHASFLVTAGLFWWVVLQPAGRRRLGYGAAILYVSAFAGMMGVFAAVLTFAPAPWYVVEVHRTAAWSLTALEDQQLAGLIMWIPGSLVYLAAAAFCFVRWLDADNRAARRGPLKRTPYSPEAAYVAPSAAS